MCKIHIYLIDEESLRWLIVNEYIGERFTNDRYTGKFIIINWNETDSRVYIKIICYDGSIRSFSIDDGIKLKITRKLKLKNIQREEIDNDFHTFEEQVIVNTLRFNKLKSVCDKNKNDFPRVSNNSWYWDRRNPSRKNSRTQKRQKLAKENRSNNKSKNR